MLTRPGRAAGSRPRPIRAARNGERRELIDNTPDFSDNAEKALADISLLPN